MAAISVLHLCSFGLLVCLYPVGWAQGDVCVSGSLAAYSARNPQCTVRGDCLGVDCSIQGGDGGTASLTVSNCEDPVRVQLSVVRPSQNCNQMFTVGGEGVYMEDRVVDSSSAKFMARYDRNTSHLQFSAEVVFADHTVMYVPEVWFPLTPGSCMCAELHNISDHFVFPVPTITPSCAADDAGPTPNALCAGFHCNLTYEGYTVKSYSTVDPCTETLLISVVDPSTEQPVFEHVFNQSQSMQFALEPVNPTLYVILNHYNYSMEVAVIMNLQLIASLNRTLIAPQRIILDRSACSSLITFPAAPVSGGKTGMTCDASNGNGTTQVTTHLYSTTQVTTHLYSTTQVTTQSPQRSIVAVAVAVPVTIIMVGLILTSIFLTVFLLYFRARKRRETGFRRVAFDEMGEEED